MNKKLMALATDLAKVPGSTGVYRSAVEVSDGRVIVHVQTKEWTALVQVGMIEGVHPPAHWEHKTALAMARAVNRFDGWKWAGEDVVHECGLTVTPRPGPGPTWETPPLVRPEPWPVELWGNDIRLVTLAARASATGKKRPNRPLLVGEVGGRLYITDCRYVVIQGRKV